MYRVIITDDEPWILKGIRSTFRWQEYGFEVVAETTDSEQAWELIQREKPEVVITDIRMPELSGMDLMRMSREAGLDASFILISGIADFHYAKESIRLGCFDYLLKPLQFEEADNVLSRLSEHLRAADRRKQTVALETLLRGSEAQLEQLLRSRGFDWQGGTLQALQVEAPSEKVIEEAVSWLGGTERIVIRPQPGQAVIVASGEQSLQPQLAALRQASPYAAGLLIGVSSRSARLGELGGLLEEAVLALSSSFIFPEGGVFEYRKESLPALRSRVHELCAALRQPAAELSCPQFEAFPGWFREAQASMRDVVYFWNQMVSTLHQPGGGGGLQEELQFMDHAELMQQFADFEQLCQYLKRLALPESRQWDDMNQVLVNEHFARLLEYVNRHYMEELQLKELSHQFYINYTYCCDLFQKVTKSTFTDYITRLRLKKAELLLRESRAAIVEICQQVGYKDYTYFNKVFKKWYGLTPSNYRKSKMTQ